MSENEQIEERRFQRLSIKSRQEIDNVIRRMADDYMPDEEFTIKKIGSTKIISLDDYLDINPPLSDKHPFIPLGHNVLFIICTRVRDAQCERRDHPKIYAHYISRMITSEHDFIDALYGHGYIIKIFLACETLSDNIYRGKWVATLTDISEQAASIFIDRHKAGLSDYELLDLCNAHPFIRTSSHYRKLCKELSVEDDIF